MASNKDRGYIVDVIYENEKKKFKCMLCLAIIKKATHGCKKHVFCKECVHDYIKSIERTEDSLAIQIKCPSGCGHTFNKNELISNDYADQIINQISCRCKDCDWSGELLDFVQVHEGKCIEKEVSCLLCSNAVKRKVLDQHLKDECSHRPVACRGCQRNFPFVDHLKHEESCDDIKVECSFINYGCNVQDRRRNMITHENNSNKQHLRLIAKYFTDENNQLKEETKQFKEESKQLKRESNQSKIKTELLEEEIIQVKEETNQLKDEIKQLKEEAKQLKEENKQVKEKVRLLETNIKMSTRKSNIQQILLKEPANRFFHFPAVDEMHIKEINILFPKELFDCFNQNNFTWIIKCLANKCDVFNNYKGELNELISSTKTIMIDRGYGGVKCYLFQMNDFKLYKNEFFSVKKDGNIFYMENYNIRNMTFFISKWIIRINNSMTQIDITKPDEQFIESVCPSLSSRYFSVLN